MIGIRTKSTFLLWTVVVLIIITMVIWCICCQHDSKRTMETNEKIAEKTVEIEITEDGDANQAITPVSLGEFKLTAYCPCVECCGIWANNRPNGVVYGSIGEELKEGYSIAVDPTVISYGTEVIINGRTYKAQDCGGAIKGNRIDIYFDSHNDALEFGVQYAEVLVVPK